VDADWSSGSEVKKPWSSDVDTDNNRGSFGKTSVKEFKD
jgi:hypothetical protein